LALADAEAEADALAEAFADIFTCETFGVGAAVVSVALGEVLADALAEVAWAGATSAVAVLGVVLGWCPLIVIAAATPPGAPTTVPASAATVIAGYFRVQDRFGSDWVIGDLRLCFAWLPTVGSTALSFGRLPG
jgi:hypothetical protein